jgi:MFS family permease
VPRPHENLVPVPHQPLGHEVRAQHRGIEQAPERGVDATLDDGGERPLDGGVRQHHDVQVHPRILLVEGVEPGRGRDPTVEHVHPQRPPAGPHGGRRAVRGPQQLPGVGEEGLPLDAERRAPPGPREQSHTERAFQRCDPLRDGLLTDPELVPGGLEAAEGPYPGQVHAADDRQPLVVARRSRRCWTGRAAAGFAAPVGLRWLWASFAVSTYGTWCAFGAFSLLAIDLLRAGPAEVSLLSAAGPAAGAVLAVGIGPWIEFRRKRPTMVLADLVRCAAMASVPAAVLLHTLTLGQLVAVAVVVAAARIAFDAASGAFLRTLLPADRLLRANGRFESTRWSASVVGPVLGGAVMSVLGPVVTVLADAASYLLSALGLTRIRQVEVAPPRPDRVRPTDLAAGWRFLLRDPVLRPLFLNGVLVNGLIMACEPLLAVLLLGELGFPPWWYGLAFAVPCVGGLVGSRLSARLVARYGRVWVLRVLGTARVCWPIGLAFVGPGVVGLVTVMAVELGLILCMGLYNPVLATVRLEGTEPSRLARVLAAWAITSSLGIAGLTVLWGVLAQLVGARAAIGTAGVLLLSTPVLLRGVGRPGHE